MTSTRKTNGTKNASAASELPPPAYFLSLTVENVRCFSERQTLDLSDGNDRPRQWTILLGENGVGKTTLLQSLARLQSYETSAFATGKIAFIPLVFLNPYSTSIQERNLKPRGESVLFHLESKICINSKLSSLVRSKIIDNWCLDATHLSGNSQGTYENLGGLICYGYGAGRRMGTTDLSESQSMDTIISLFDDNATLINAEEWLLQADYAAKSLEGANQKRAADRLIRIKKALCDLLPDVSDIDFKPTKTVPIRIMAQAKTPYGWVSIKDLSLGYRTMMTWMVDFASRLLERYPDSPNPLAEPAIALIDEIDLHLHPKWQRTLVQDLSKTFPNTQFIVSAHSPLVVQSATDANIVLLQRVDDHVEIKNKMEMRKGLRVDQLLTSDLFGLESARPPQIEDALRERSHILSKSRLTAKDKSRLRELGVQIGALPTGELPQDIEAMDVLRRAAEFIKQG